MHCKFITHITINLQTAAASNNHHKALYTVGCRLEKAVICVIFSSIVIAVVSVVIVVALVDVAVVVVVVFVVVVVVVVAAVVVVVVVITLFCNVPKLGRYGVLYNFC